MCQSHNRQAQIQTAVGRDSPKAPSPGSSPPGIAMSGYSRKLQAAARSAPLPSEVALQTSRLEAELKQLRDRRQAAEAEEAVSAGVS